jgi:hypothetical protein
MLLLLLLWVCGTPEGCEALPERAEGTLGRLRSIRAGMRGAEKWLAAI